MSTPPFNPQPCCDSAVSAANCMQPTQFCFTSTAPVDQPGRQYGLSFVLAQGFAVQSIVKDLVESPVNIVWDVNDTDASQFSSNLQAALQSQFPGQTVTVFPGSVDPCTGLATFNIVIQCVRLDQDPTTLLQLKYNAGRDLIINPSFVATPPQSQFAFMKREDATSGVTTADVLCTDTANRGWETNDKSNSFETWGPPGSSQNVFEGTTPTPRGTVVQEINSYGSGATPTTGPNAGNPAYGVDPNTIWQTFTVPASGNFIIKVVVGGRAGTENIPIKLSTGDVNAGGIGDIINTSVNAPKVTNEGGTDPGPWTSFTQTVPLAAGVYTLAFTGPDQNPPTSDNAFGGLFTDMRVYQDAPNTIADFTNDDTVCTVPTTVNSTTCEFWAPTCSAGVISAWTKTSDGTTLTNAEFWAQVPAPSCCSGATSGGTSGGAGNLVDSYLVCATLNGETRTMSRVVVTDQSGGIISQQFIDTDGAPVTPDTWQPGSCSATRFVEDVVLCDYGAIQPDGYPAIFLRKFVQSLDATGQGQVDSHKDFTILGDAPYVAVGPVSDCSEPKVQPVPLCDAGNSNHTFLRYYLHTGNTVTGTTDTELDGVTPYAFVGPAVVCTANVFTTTGLCLGDGTPIGIVNRRNSLDAIVQDGWINLLTGAFSAGIPPVGTNSCAQSLSIQTSDVLCDITTATGVVNALVLIQYHYNPDGTIASTSIINATTGAPYTPVGTVTVCPTDTAVPDNDMQVLCDRQADGTLVPFIRDYHRDAVGVINGFSNYTLGGASYTVTGTVQSCVPRVSESMILCDSGTPNVRFVRTYTYNSNGAIQTFFDTTLAGAPFVPTGAVHECGSPGTANVTLNCTDVASAQFYTSPNLLANGDFESSTGISTTSLPGPVWTSSYTPCGPSIFAGPCGAATWAFFNTNAGQVTGGNPAATPILALGNRSMAVNVGPSLTAPIILWSNVYLVNGRTYEMSADAAVIIAPYDVALRIGGPTGPGGNFPLTTPPTSAWGKTTALFTYAGTTGYTTVGLYSNNTAPAGNDHTFDNFSLRSVQPAQSEVTTPVPYDTTARAVVDQVVETAGCNDARRDELLGNILNSVTPQPFAQLDATIQRQTNAGTITITPNARSVTVTVFTGPVTVNLGQGVTTLPTGYSATWAVDGPGESVADQFAFTGVAGSDFMVVSTRQ